MGGCSFTWTGSCFGPAPSFRYAFPLSRATSKMMLSGDLPVQYTSACNPIVGREKRVVQTSSPGQPSPIFREMALQEPSSSQEVPTTCKGNARYDKQLGNQNMTFRHACHAAQSCSSTMHSRIPFAL